VTAGGGQYGGAVVYDELNNRCPQQHPLPKAIPATPAINNAIRFMPTSPRAVGEEIRHAKAGSRTAEPAALSCRGSGRRRVGRAYDTCQGQSASRLLASGDRRPRDHAGYARLPAGVSALSSAIIARIAASTAACQLSSPNAAYSLRW